MCHRTNFVKNLIENQQNREKGCRGEGDEWFHSAFHVLLHASYLEVLERRFFSFFFLKPPTVTPLDLCSSQETNFEGTVFFLNRKIISFA